MHSFRRFLEGYMPLSDADWQIVETLLKKQEVPARYRLLCEGQTEKKIYFIEKGIVRFFYDIEGEDKSFSFIFENDIATAYDSFLLQEPSAYFSETLAPSVLYSISYENLQQIYRQVPGSNYFGRVLCEKIFLLKAAREHSLLKQTPEERYLKILQDKKHLLQHIPLRHIASYIGITPQALSRIRKRIS